MVFNVILTAVFFKKNRDAHSALYISAFVESR